MNVASALNKRYVDFAIVMLYSLAVNQQEDIQAYLLHSELDDDDIHRMKKNLAVCGNLMLHFLRVDNKMFPEQLPCTDFWSIETYYRLMLLDFLPEDMDRILYLDIDMIVNGSLQDIYDMDLQGRELISCLDANGNYPTRNMEEKRRKLFDPILRNGNSFFNAGFVLFHLSEMRNKGYCFRYYMRVAQEVWHYDMELQDQDLLNYVHGGKVGYVDDVKYNLFARVAYNRGLTLEDVRNSAVVVHYAGYKPWNTTYAHYSIEKLWWEYAKQTPIYYDLLERFMEESLSDSCLESYIKSLIKDNHRLRRSLKALKAASMRLVQIVEG